jgi:hypothetical protein
VRREARQPPAKRVVNETLVLNRPRKGAKLREEVWQTEEGEVTKYNLAYINHLVCQVDNGRVLGYDNSHDYHHRHFMGNVESIEFTGYESLAARFREEVQELWRKENENGQRTQGRHGYGECLL